MWGKSNKIVVNRMTTIEEKPLEELVSALLRTQGVKNPEDVRLEFRKPWFGPKYVVAYWNETIEREEKEA